MFVENGAFFMLYWYEHSIYFMNQLINFAQNLNLQDIARIKHHLEIILYTLGAILIILAIVFFVFSYLFYRKKTSAQTNINYLPTKAKGWWIKYRAHVLLMLGVLFALLAFGSLLTVGQIVSKIAI